MSDLKTYTVKASITVYARDEADALENAAICLDNYHMNTGECSISGAGWQRGTVRISEGR